MNSGDKAKRPAIAAFPALVAGSFTTLPRAAIIALAFTPEAPSAIPVIPVIVQARLRALLAACAGGGMIAIN
jgi:hypothetical protein